MMFSLSEVLWRRERGTMPFDQKTLKEQKDLPKINARYIGERPMVLRAVDGPHLNAKGERLTSRLISRGDTLKVHPVQVLGQTYLHDPKGNLPSQWIGVGRVTLPEHAGLPDAVLDVLGYEFHEGRPDFEPYSEEEEPPAQEPEEKEEEEAVPGPSSPSTAAQQEAVEGSKGGGSGRGRGKVRGNE